jgi:hypothetical protein
LAPPNKAPREDQLIESARPGELEPDCSTVRLPQLTLVGPGWELSKATASEPLRRVKDTAEAAGGGVFPPTDPAAAADSSSTTSVPPFILAVQEGALM